MLFDSKYNYMYSLEKGSFFGEYNIMFGLKSNINYMGKIKKTNAKNANIVFKIKAEVLISVILDDANTYKHFYNIAL